MNSSTNTNVTVPSWAIRMFGIAQPLVVAFLIWVSALMWSLNQQVTILNVKMEVALKTDGKLEALGDRINLISERMSRIEAQLQK